MINVYVVNSNREYTGEYRTLKQGEGRESNWIPSETPPPDVTPPEVAFWNGDEWGVRDAPIPPPPPSVFTWADATDEYFHLEVGSFYDRLGDAKIAVLSSENAIVQALIRDTQIRKFIDIGRPDVVQFVHLLCDKVPDVTEEVAAGVLKLESTDFERHIKGLPQPEPEP